MPMDMALNVAAVAVAANGLAESSERLPIARAGAPRAADGAAGGFAERPASPMSPAAAPR